MASARGVAAGREHPDQGDKSSCGRCCSTLKEDTLFKYLPDVVPVVHIESAVDSATV